MLWGNEAEVDSRRHDRARPPLWLPDSVVATCVSLGSAFSSLVLSRSALLTRYLQRFCGMFIALRRRPQNCDRGEIRPRRLEARR